MAHKQVFFRAEACDKILRETPENAVYVASMSLLSEATLTEIPEKKPESTLGKPLPGE